MSDCMAAPLGLRKNAEAPPLHGASRVSGLGRGEYEKLLLKHYFFAVEEPF
jgi:hypothetical protein